MPNRLLPTHRSPTHPGEMLLEEFLRPIGRTAGAFARRAGLRSRQVHRLLAGHGSVTPRLAQRLGRATGMSTGFWLGLQGAHDWWSTGESAPQGMVLK